MTSNEENRYQDKARGMLAGLAIGDALGAPVEFGYDSEKIIALGDKIKRYTEHRLSAGEWTDDTSMALCIADSLLERKGYDSFDLMDRFTRWLEDGYRTPDGLPAGDVGHQTRGAIEGFKTYPTITIYDQKTTSAGNGPIMRLAPVIIANTFPKKKYPTLKDGYEKGKLALTPEDDDKEFISLEDIEPTINMAILSCRETHNCIAAEATTALFATMLYCALHGLPKNNIAAYCDRWTHGEEYDQFWIENIDELVGRGLEKDGSALRDLGGYIVDSFAISLWGLMHFDNFEDGMLAVIRLGGDTDTNAACYGQLAGAYYGYESIPEEWRRGVCMADELVEIADKLLAMPECPVLKTRFEDVNEAASTDPI